MNNVLVAKMFIPWLKHVYSFLSYFCVLSLISGSIDLNIVHDVIFETRLSHDVLPNSYQLHLKPFLNNCTFFADLQLNITWYKRTKNVTLHLDENVNIDSLLIRNINFNFNVENFTISRNKIKSWLIIEFVNLVECATQYELNFQISGPIENKTNDGFFTNSYVNEYNETKTFAASNFRPNFARKLFPCFDEPFFKAPFTLSVLRNENQVSLSNMPLKISKNDDRFCDHFMTSPSMPVYTLGIVISEFAKVQDENCEINSTERIRIWSRNDYHLNLQKISTKTEYVLKVLENYFNMTYPLPKLDLVALPKFRNSKQADNWGIILFRENDLTSDVNSLRRIFHECIYQWIGSLVTPNWWSDSHINKALNSFLAIHLAIKESNGYEMQNWPMTSLYSIYYEYGTENPISRVSGLRQEILSVKTELVFRMINYTLGETVFQSAIGKFLKAKQYNTFMSSEILDYFTTEAHINAVLPTDKTVNEIVESWILSKEKLPVITVVRNYEENTATIKQEVFSRNYNADNKSKRTYLWYIPIIIVTQTTLNFHKFQINWMTNTSDEIIVENLPDKDNFIIVNPEEIGPFQVNYDSRNWNLLLNYLVDRNHLNIIPRKTKAKLLNEALNFAYSGMLSFDQALNFTLFLKYERDPIVWEPIFPMIDHISKKIAGTAVNYHFEIYARNLFLNLYEYLLQNEILSSNDTKIHHLRKTSRKFLCFFGFKPCYEEARDIYEKWISMNSDYSISYTNLCTVFKWGSDEDWELGYNLMKKFPANRKLIERTTVLKTLTICTQGFHKIQKILQSVVFNEDNQFSENDINMVLLSVITTGNGYKALYDFLVKNWKHLKNIFANKHQIWDKIVYSATSSLKTDEELVLLQNFFDEKETQFYSAEVDIKRSLQHVKQENQWIHQNLPVIESWLNLHLTNERKGMFFTPSV